MHSLKDVADAENVLALLDGNVEELPYSEKTTVKAGSIIRGFQGDPQATILKQCFSLTQPLQWYLNKVFEVDRLVSAAVSAICILPDKDSTVEAVTKAARANLAFLTGDCGKTVVSKFTSMLEDLEGPEWGVASPDASERLKSSPQITTMLVGSWRRMVFYFSDGRFKIFACCGRGGKGVFEPARVSTVHSAVQSRGAECRVCNDPFAEEMCRLLVLMLGLGTTLCIHYRKSFGWAQEQSSGNTFWGKI